MDITDLIIFCGSQILGLIAILLRKKFRTLPNYMLIFILINISMHYIYYFFYYSGAFNEFSPMAYSMVPMATVAPIFIYFYVVSILHGKISLTKKSLVHLIPLIITGVIFILYLNSINYRKLWIFIANNICISLYIIYPWIAVKTMSKYYEMKTGIFKVFRFNKKKTSLIKLLLSMMTLHFVILLVKNNLSLFVEGSEQIMNIINLSFFLILGYAVSYVIISEPKTIQRAEEKIGLGGFKKYERSKLTRSKALDNVRVLNSVMEDTKPYLDPEFDLVTLSQLSQLPAHNISETLNGLIGQSFNDYTNNYRVEEFKKLASKEEYKNFTILALAFEAGFKSKSTFNAAFKKFTGKTPSEYIKQL